MSAGRFCGVAPFLFRKKTSGIEVRSSSKTSENLLNTSKVVKSIKVCSVARSSSGVANNFVTITLLRNKIATFRDLLDFSPCATSDPTQQVLVLTLHDIYKRYPRIEPEQNERQLRDTSLHKVLYLLCDALKSLGDLWTTEKWMIKSKYDSFKNLERLDLEEAALGLLEDMNNLARERLFDDMHEDEEEMSEGSPAFGKALAESYDSSASFSPVTPNSVLPQAWKSSTGNENAEKVSYSPSRLLPLRVQAVGKLNPIDVKRLSFHMFPHIVSTHQDPDQGKGGAEKKNDQELEVKDDGGRKHGNEGIKNINTATTMLVQIQEDMREPEIVGDEDRNIISSTPIQTQVDSRELEKVGIEDDDTISQFPMKTQNGSREPENVKMEDGNTISPVQLQTTQNEEQSGPFLPTLLPSFLPPEISCSDLAEHLSSASSQISPLAAHYHPPPPPATSRNLEAPPPPPPPPFEPLPIELRNSAAVIPPLPPLVPAAKAIGSAPPPPPMLGSLRAKKAATKLKRSSQMGNLYRVLKGKVEGSVSEVKSSGRKGKIGVSISGGKQGMADALAEMTKRSAYFQQIEEDVKNYEGVIKELKSKINSFQTSDMAELLKFHTYVESHLEKLTDESQVLARFEEFPVKKLEAFRTAASLYSKLSSIVTTLQNWQLGSSSVSKLLDKLESYFNKIKVEIDALDRTKDEEAKKFQAHKIKFDFGILIRIKELMVDLSSNCMELALKEKRESSVVEESKDGKPEHKNRGSVKMLWRAFQLAFRVYTFAGGHDDRADHLTRELAQEIETGDSSKTASDPKHVSV